MASAAFRRTSKRLPFLGPGTGPAYVRAVASGLVSKSIVGISGLVVVWLLNAILGKDDFAHCMIGLTINQTLALVVGSGFEKIVLYHVSRLDDASEHSRSRRIAGAGLCGAAIVSLLLGVLVFFLSTDIAGWIGKPEAAIWLAVFAPTIPFSVLNAVQAGWMQARQMVVLSVLFDEVLPNLLRPLLLGLVWILAIRQPDATALSVGASLLAAFVVPFVWLYAIRPAPITSPAKVLTRWDLRYGLTVMLTRLADQRIQSISVVLVGIWQSASVTADFVLASRMALLLGVLQLVMNLLLVPRLGSFLARGNSSSLLREYDTTRFFALLTTIAGAAAYLLVGPMILRIFGDYGGAYPMLALLSAAMVVRVGFGANGQYLMMSGYAGWRLLNTLGAVVVIIVLSWPLIPALGGEGAAIAAFLSVLFANGMAAIVIKRLDKLQTVDANVLWVMTLSSALLFAVGFKLMPSLPAAAGLALITAWVLITHRSTWQPVVGVLLNRKSA